MLKDALQEIKDHIATLTDEDIVYFDKVYKRYLVFFDGFYEGDGGLSNIEGEFDDIQLALLECIRLNHLDDMLVLFDRQVGKKIDVGKMIKKATGE